MVVRLSDKVGLFGDLGGGIMGILLLSPNAANSCTKSGCSIDGKNVTSLLTVNELCFLISTGCSRDVIGSGTDFSGFFRFCLVLTFSSKKSVEFVDLDDQIFLKKCDIFLEFDLISFGDSGSTFEPPLLAEVVVFLGD